MPNYRGLHLSELIEELVSLKGRMDEEDLDPIIMISSDYGDHCHTEQLNFIEDVVICLPEKTGYSHTGLCLGEEIDEPEETSDKIVIVLRYIK